MAASLIVGPSSPGSMASTLGVDVASPRRGHRDRARRASALVL